MQRAAASGVLRQRQARGRGRAGCGPACGPGSDGHHSGNTGGQSWCVSRRLQLLSKTSQDEAMKGEPRCPLLSGYYVLGASQAAHCKEPSFQPRRHRIDPWVRKTLWRGNGQLAPVFLPGESHEQRSPEGYSARGHRGLDPTEHAHVVCWALCQILYMHHLVRRVQ